MSTRPIQDLIAAWPSRKALAAEIGAKTDAVHKWFAADRIPSHWQADVVRAAQGLGLAHVTAEWMLEAHSGSRGGVSVTDHNVPSATPAPGAEAAQ